ncbi:MAG: cytochrome c oxidase accessory protein CcoG [Gammaproteobacteria bacterium RBG_16_57_12]|nr:MAG: cytochrome c oxidase accessory protein CcoG [Gammaproteobacteria bacterium RBG_16_57_12]
MPKIRGPGNEQQSTPVEHGDVREIYEESHHWIVNTGNTTVHAKPVKGRFRRLKNLGWYIWFGYFLTPYIRWDGNQAILFDIPNRQFHLFSITVYPQDIWMLALVLILLAMTLFGVTAVASRVFCGYFCFQTVWTDWFTRVEDWIEGSPQQRRKLDESSWTGEKLRKRAMKYSIWGGIAILTGVSFAAYFTDVYQLWIDIFTLQAPPAAWVTLLLFFLGTFYLAGFLREQVCLWLCPYGRIQGVMLDRDTILPTYDRKRGEPRGKIKSKSEITAAKGDCIDCKLCVAVCPTGVDIREGQQSGCITCGLCIDACDEVMEKVNRPAGLIRYASEKEMDGEHVSSLFRRPRVIIYLAIFILSSLGIVYGLLTIPPIEWHVIHERQPLYTMMSDGSIQNSYVFKVFNKTKQDLVVRIHAEDIAGVELHGVESETILKAEKLIPFTVRLRAVPENLPEQKVPVRFILDTVKGPPMHQENTSFFARP